MAELTVTDTTTDRCCAPERQATCCEPSAKADCCGHGEGCGCDAGSPHQRARRLGDRARTQATQSNRCTTLESRS